MYLYDGHLDPEVDDFVAATPVNIAAAEDDAVPSGYTRVDSAQASR